MRVVIRRHLLVIAVALLGSLGGCATPPPADDQEAITDFNETNDPIEPTNRAIYAFNNGLDTVIMRPTTRAGPRGYTQCAVQSRHASAIEQ